MENLKIEAVIDFEKVQAKANEMATNAMISVLSDYYDGYQSPFKTKLKESLVNLNSDFNLVDIHAHLIEATNSKMKEIADNMVTKAIVPMVNKMLVGEKTEGPITIQNILDKFKEVCVEKDSEICEVDFEAVKHDNYDWITLKFGAPGHRADSFEITLHKEWQKEGEYRVLSLPRSDKETTMVKVTTDSYTYEVPVSKRLADNDFARYVCALMINGTTITADPNKLYSFDTEIYTEQDNY